MSLLTNFPHECTIQKRIRSKGGLMGNIDRPRSIEQTAVACWEQAATYREIVEFDKRGMTINRKVYFLSDPGVTEAHEILITKRNGVTITSPTELDVMSESLPDATAGMGVVFKVMVNEKTGANQ